MSLIGVECNADRYFFGRLFNNKNIIRKEKNDVAVIKGVFENSKGNFSLGIIDIDKNIRIRKEVELLFEIDNYKIIKDKENYQFIILVGPRQLEHFLYKFIEIEEKKIENFGFDNFNHFMEISKSFKPELNQNFKSVIDFIIKNYSKSDNYILKLKKQIDYIIKERYNFNIEEFNKI